MKRRLRAGEGAGLLAAAALILVFVAQLTLRSDAWIVGLALSAVAALTFALAVRRSVRSDVTDRLADLTAGADDSAQAGSQTWPRRSLALFGAAALLLIALWINADPAHMGTRVWVLQLAAVVMVLAAGFVADWGLVTPAPLPAWGPQPSRWVGRGLLALIVAGGAWLRFRNLDAVPYGFWFDEADVALIARRMVEDSSYRPVFIDVMPGYHGYIIAWLFRIFGESVTAVRAVSAAFGIGTILAGYLAGRELFGRSAGLVLAYLIAFSRWSLTLSRVGMHNVTVPFFSLLMLGLMLRAYRRRSTLDWVLAGLVAGSGMIFYSAMSSAILALALFAFIVAFRSRDRFRWALPRFAAALLASLIMFVPLGKFAIEESDTYFYRNRTTAIWSDSANIEDGQRWSAVKDNVVTYLAMTHHEGDPNGRHNRPGEPMFPPVVAGLTILGFAVAGVRVAKSFGLLAAIWAPFALLPGILSLPWESPNSLRAVAAQPVGLLLATGAVFGAYTALSSSRRLRTGFAALAIVVLGGTALWDVSGYFGRQADDFAVWAQHSTKETMAANLIVDAGDETQTRRVGFLKGQKSLDFIVGPSGDEEFFGTDVSLPLALDPMKDALILTVPETYDIVAQAPRLYPGAIVETYPNEDHWPDGKQWPSELTSIAIPKEDIVQSLGLKVDEVDGLYRAAGTLVTSEAGLYRFRLVGPEPGQLFVNDVPLAQCGELSASAGLAEGVHQLELVSNAEGDLPAIEWLPPGAEAWSLIPTERLLQPWMIEGGLVGTWFENIDDPNALTLRRIDSSLKPIRFHELPIDRPYFIEWAGKLTIPDAGLHTFHVRTDDEATLSLDGIEILRTGPEGGDMAVEVPLDIGVKPIVVTYHDTEGGSFIEVSWKPPGREKQPIAASLLTPAAAEASAGPNCT